MPVAVELQASSAAGIAESPWAASLDRVLSWAASQDYYGYSKFDALNSPIMSAITLGNARLRTYVSAAWARSPVNLRPLFLTKKKRNPKGMALFALAYLRRFRAFGDESDLVAGRSLLNWLRENANTSYTGLCWGYCHPWYSLHFYAPRYSPNIVVTGNVAYAFIEAYELTRQQKYLEVARSAVDFILSDLEAPIRTESMRSISYVPVSQWSVLNINGLAASILCRVARHTGEHVLTDEAAKLIAFLIDKQHENGAWHYAWPSTSSNVLADNYHTGNKLDWVLDYCSLSGDSSYLDNFHRGLTFYREHLFRPDGAPRWRSDRTYPIDVHGSAQGIVTFSKAALEDDRSYIEDARRIASWAISNLQAPAGYFYYQKGRLLARKYTLMRWCNAWMAYALASLVRAEEQLGGGQRRAEGRGPRAVRSEGLASNIPPTADRADAYPATRDSQPAPSDSAVKTG